MRAAQALAREETRLRQVAEGSLGTVTDDARTAAERAAAVFKTERDARMRAEKQATDEADRLVKRDAELAEAAANITRLSGLLAHAQDRVRTLMAELDLVVERRAAAVADAFRSGFEHARAVLDSNGVTPATQVGQLLVSALGRLDSSPDARDRGEPGPGPGPVRDRD